MITRFLQVRVTTRANISELMQNGENWAAKLRSPPVDGKANEELIGLVAKAFGCGRASVTIKSGAASRTKLVKVTVEEA